jgi:hypothetical protein
MMGGVASALLGVFVRGLLYEKLIQGEKMVKTFKGFVVPELLDTEKGREFVKKIFKHNVRWTGCALAGCGQCSKDNECGSCICSLLPGGTYRRQALEEYVRKYSGVPELEPGDIVRIGDWFYIYVQDNWAYRVKDEYILGINLVQPETIDNRDVEAVYRKVGGLHVLSEIAAIFRGSYEEEPYWKRPETVKEMTVDEISKALGYKVKVVGDEKTDD